MMDDTLGKIGFWMVFLGFQLAFFPMHWSGMLGMPRRVYTYPPGLGLEVPNLLSTIGAFVVGLAVVLFVVNCLLSLYRGAIAGPNPWGAATLEWETSSPPRVYNFEHVPVVESNTPLWDLNGDLPVVTGLRVDQKEMLLTTVVAAAPDVREPVPEPSLWPFIAAIAVGVVFIASIFSPWAIAVGIIPCFIALAAWFWPKELKRSPEPVIS
jgi:heme/copper-type cytochrome/quinol oxidase subunit 1